MRSTLVLAMLGLVVAVPTIAKADENSVLAQLRKLPWQSETGFSFSPSKTTLAPLPGYLMVSGPDAIAARTIEDGSASPDTEAELVGPQNQEAIFSYSQPGFISTSDWSKINADDMLKQIQANTITGNQARTARGLPTLIVTGWAQQPTLNGDTNSVSWIIEGTRSDGGQFLNAVTIKLGRFGFEKIIMVSNRDPLTAQGDLMAVANADTFDPGARYADYMPSTDHAAAYGIAGLVAGSLGVTLLKTAGIGAAIALVLKKGAFLLLLPFIWLWRKLRRNPTGA